MDEKILFKRGSWALTKDGEPHPEFVELLVRTIWGTPGKTLYQHLDTRHRITQLLHSYYITLMRKDKVLAGMTLCRRSTRESEIPADAFYVRYLSFTEQLRNKRPAKNQLVPNGDFVIHPRSFIKNQLFEVFSNPELIAPAFPDHRQPFYYAYVESENQRSLQICSAFGFQKVRSFRTLPFSRFFPKRHPEVGRLAAAEQIEVREAIEKQYQNYHLFFPEHLFHGDHYYVLKRDGKIVAGIRAMPVNWVINHLPGFSGKITMKVVPHLPLLSRLFNPRDFRFAAFEGIYFLPGYEGAVFTLMEGVLAELGLHTGMLWLDDESELYQFFLQSGKLGLLHQLEKPSPVNILVRFGEGTNPERVKAYQQAPVYISALDLT